MEIIDPVEKMRCRYLKVFSLPDRSIHLFVRELTRKGNISRLCPAYLALIYFISFDKDLLFTPSRELTVDSERIVNFFLR
jgi:hypothetical protein